MGEDVMDVDGMDINRLDIDGAIELRIAILNEVNSYYRRGPMSRNRVFEVLNALAATAAMILDGTGNDSAARDFFALVLEWNIRPSYAETQN